MEGGSNECALTALSVAGLVLCLGGGAWGSSDLVCPPCPPSQPAQEGSPRTSHCWEAGQGHGHLEEQADFVQIYRFSPYLTTVNIR